MSLVFSFQHAQIFIIGPKTAQKYLCTNATQLEQNTTSRDVGLTTGNSQVTMDASDGLRT